MQYYPPRTDAQNKWLANRRREQWGRTDDMPPPLDPVAEAERQKAISLMFRLIEERARNGQPPLLPTHDQGRRPMPALELTPRVQQNPNGHDKPNGHR
jgi:hypothetical protein